jgi:hypothetical protein
MAGPEPYPLAPRWSREQEAAYAEGRKSAKGDKSGQPSPSRGKRKRYVKTAAGEKRYGQPIGTEIGNPRNQKAAEAQKDKESTGRYGELVGADQKAQSAAMRGLKDDQLQRLSRVAYSFKSSDPNVVRLRIGVANELARRGMNVNDFGGLGRGSAQPAGPVRAGRPAPRPVRKATPARKPVKPARSAMNARKNDRRLRELSVPQLRKAIGVFSRIPQTKRRAVARVIVTQAIELGVPHFLPGSVMDAADLTPEGRTEVIELAGRWRHGWIPLDGTAMSAKMKGKTGGKKWWDGPGGSGGTKGRLHSAVGVPKDKATNRGRSDNEGRRPDMPVRTNQGKTVKYKPGSLVVSRAQAEDLNRRGKGDYLARFTDPKSMTDDKLRRTDMDLHNRARAANGGTLSPQDQEMRRKVRAELKSRGLQGYRAHDNKGNHPALDRSAPGHKSKGKSDRPKVDAERTEKLRLNAQYDQLLGKKARTPQDESKLDELYLKMTGRRRGTSSSGAQPKRKPGVSGKPENLRRSIAAGNAARARKEGGAAPKRPSSARDLPASAHPDLREALEDGMDKSAVHRSTGGGYAVDNGDGTWSAFNQKGQILAYDAKLKQFPADAWPTIKRGSAGRTSVVKSGSTAGKTRGAGMNAADDVKGAEGRAIQYLETNGAADTRAYVRKLAAKQVKTSVDKANIAALRRALNSDASRSPASRNRLSPEQIAKRSQVNRTPTGGLPDTRSAGASRLPNSQRTPTGSPAKSPRSMDDGELQNAKAKARRDNDTAMLQAIEAEQERRRKAAGSGQGWQSGAAKTDNSGLATVDAEIQRLEAAGESGPALDALRNLRKTMVGKA